MTPAAALVTAGRGAVLVHRPTGVLHVYTGPLTRTGAAVPRRHRAVCRTRTRRLTVAPIPSDGRHQVRARLCAHCSARLHQGGRAEPLRTRLDVATRHAGLDEAHLIRALAAAVTPADVALVGQVALTVLSRPARGRNGVPTSFAVAMGRARVRVADAPDPTGARLAELRPLVDARRRAENAEAWAERENRIRRIGITNAKPAQRGSRRTR